MVTNKDARKLRETDMTLLNKDLQGIRNGQGVDDIQKQIRAYAALLRRRKDRSETRQDDPRPEYDPEVLLVELDSLHRATQASGRDWKRCGDIDRVMRVIKREQAFFDRLIDNGYHNADHTRRVLERVQVLADHHDLSGRHRHTLMFAAAYHDYAHSVLGRVDFETEDARNRRIAETIDMDTEQLRQLQAAYESDSADIREEEFAALIASERLGPDNDEYPTVPAAQRAEVVVAILGTRFDLETNDPMASHHTSRMLIAADIGDVCHSFEEWFEQSLNVWAEQPPRAVSTVGEWVEVQKAFLREHVAPRFGVVLQADGAIVDREAAIVPHDGDEDWLAGLQRTYRRLDSLPNEQSECEFDDTQAVIKHLRKRHTPNNVA